MPRVSLRDLFCVAPLGNPGLRSHDERLATDIERDQTAQIHHSILAGGHIEHGKKVSHLGIVGQIAPVQVLSDSATADHFAHCAVFLAEEDREDSATGFVPQELERAPSLDLGNFVLLDRLHCWIVLVVSTGTV